MKDKFDSIIQHLEVELANIHIGRVTPAVLESIMITAYDTDTELKQLASITNQDAQTLLVQPWDASILKDIETGLRNGKKDLNPVVDGNTIRIVFPPLTEEKRKEVVKQMQQICEEAKVSVKKVREDLMNSLKNKKQNKEISEDDFFAEQKDVQKLVDEYNNKIKELGSAKENELMAI